VVDRRGKGWSEEEIALGLRALAKNFGNAPAAARELKQAGTPIPARTLADWRQSRHATRYREVRAEIERLVLEDLGEEMLAQAREDAEAADLARREFVKQLKAGKIPARDLAGAVRNMRVSQSLGVDKSRLVTDRPTSIVRREGPTLEEVEQAIRDIERIERMQAVDSTAEEIHDAELEPAPRDLSGDPEREQP
jgi:hypothetical protein